MGYISKQIYFGGRIIINKNINTAIYIMFLQQINICLRRREKSNKCIVTRVTILFFVTHVTCDSRYIIYTVCII